MKVLDFAIALRRASQGPRREVAPRSPGGGQVIDFPVRERSGDQDTDLAFCEGNFVCQYDASGWRDWLPNESSFPL